MWFSIKKDTLQCAVFFNPKEAFAGATQYFFLISSSRFIQWCRKKAKKQLYLTFELSAPNLIFGSGLFNTPRNGPLFCGPARLKVAKVFFRPARPDATLVQPTQARWVFCARPVRFGIEGYFLYKEFFSIEFRDHFGNQQNWSPYEIS